MLDGGRASYAVYETKDGRFISVGALEPKFWKAFCYVINRKDFIPLIDAPLHEQYRLKYEIQQIMVQRTQHEWVAEFANVDACVTPLLTLEEMTRNPQVIARKMILRAIHPDHGEMRQIGIPVKLSKTPGTIHSHAPKHGEHTWEILRELKLYNE